MVTRIFGFDTSIITLGDGALNVESAIFGVEKVSGSRCCVRDPRLSHLVDKLPQLWKAPTQMAQLAPGMKWCKTCGDVRPLSYFDVLTYDEKHKPLIYASECRQCVNSHDPKLSKEKYCSACRVMHPKEAFADDDRYADGKFPVCINGKRRASAADYARDQWVNQGRVPGQWGGNRQRVAV